MSDIEKPIQVFPGYEQLANVLQDALDQAQAGKGSQRHANGKPFLEQPIITDGRACGLAGHAFQARKKILEALHCPYEERAVQDLLGAIVYTAAMVILKREERQKRNEANQYAEPWQSAISEQEACGVSTSPPIPNDNSNPLVHVVPDRTSRRVDDATASQMYERHKREMEQYRSND